MHIILSTQVRHHTLLAAYAASGELPATRGSIFGYFLPVNIEGGHDERDVLDAQRRTSSFDTTRNVHVYPSQ